MQCPIDTWLKGFELDAMLHAQTAVVMASLPPDVRQDFMDDPAFIMCDYEPGPDAVMRVPMRFGSQGAPGRSVVLKRTLRRRSSDFVKWVIAHELAHAHLRNAGRWQGEDPERAADALAAGWGFPRPTHVM